MSKHDDQFPELPRQPIKVDMVRAPVRIVELKIGDHITIDGLSGQISGYSFVVGLQTIEIVCTGASSPGIMGSGWGSLKGST